MQQGLKVPQRQPTRIRLCLSDESFIRIRPLRRDHVWRCDFAMVRTTDGNTVRILVIIDEFTRECLKMVVARSLGSKELLEALWGLFVARGIPEYIRPDNGPEFAAKAVRQWLARVGVKTLLVGPEGPCESGHDEAFVGKMRDELLNREVFETFQEARVVMGLGPYDELRTHGSLSYTPPAPETGRLEARGAPALRLAHSPAAGHPDSPSQDASVRGESGHDAPRHGVEEHLPPAHLEPPSEGAVTGIEERGNDLPVAPARGDGDHKALQAEGREAVGVVPSAPLQPPHETAALEIEEQEIDLLKAPVRGDGGRVPPAAHPQALHGAADAARDEQPCDSQGVRQGSLEEIEVLRRGAEKGLSGFQLELGERYAKGVKGVPRDCAEARKWLTRAFHDPEFPEHKDQAEALLKGLKDVMGAGAEAAASGFPWMATARLRSSKTWLVVAAIAAVAAAVLLWVSR